MYYYLEKVSSSFSIVPIWPSDTSSNVENVPVVTLGSLLDCYPEAIWELWSEVIQTDIGLGNPFMDNMLLHLDWDRS